MRASMSWRRRLRLKRCLCRLSLSFILHSEESGVRYRHCRFMAVGLWRKVALTLLSVEYVEGHLEGAVLHLCRAYTHIRTIEQDIRAVCRGRGVTM